MFQGGLLTSPGISLSPLPSHRRLLQVTSSLWALLLVWPPSCSLPSPSSSLVVISCQEPSIFHSGQPATPSYSCTVSTASYPAAQASVPSLVGQLSLLLGACWLLLPKFQRLTRWASSNPGLPLSSLWFYAKFTASSMSFECLCTGSQSQLFLWDLVLTLEGGFTPGSGCSEVTGKACTLAA